MIILLVALAVGAVGCSVPWVTPSGDTRTAQEWRGQIIELNRDQGYIVVRSQERLLDHVFQVTRETEITGEASGSPSLEPGRWVTVRYREDGAAQGPPVAVRVFVIR